MVTHDHRVHSERRIDYRSLSQPKGFTSIKSKVKEITDQKGMNLKE